MLINEPIVEERSSRLEYNIDTKHMNPAKAQQAERLGMGVGSRFRYACVFVWVCVDYSELPPFQRPLGLAKVGPLKVV